MKQDSKPSAELPSRSRAPTPVELDKRVAARRRFLKVGGAGSAAFVMTVTHQRAFAGKKASANSACVSLQGIPDLTKITNKKALVTSVGGTPKELICRSRSNPTQTIKGTSAPLGDCTKLDGGSGPDKQSKFTDWTGQRFPVVKDKELDKGCGALDVNNPAGLPSTISASYNYRLYEKGYCPIVYNSSTGQLSYDQSAVYFEADSSGKIKKGPLKCEPQP